MEKRETRPLFGSLILLLTSVIWGLAFVAQSTGMQRVGPFTFQCSRSFLGLMAVLPVMLYRWNRNQRRPAGSPNLFEPRKMLLGGICCGLAFTSASTMQQVAMKYASAGKAGFLTAMYLVIVPLFGLFLGQRIPKRIWFCVILCMGGTYMLSAAGGSGMNAGDVLLVLCAVMFAVQILCIDHFVQEIDGVWLAFAQFLVAGIMTFLPMVLIEQPETSQIRTAAIPILYSGLMSSGVGYTLQIVGQKYTPPAAASLIMSMESVFALLGGMIIQGVFPTPKEAVGCVLVFTAVLISQLPALKLVFSQLF